MTEPIDPSEKIRVLITDDHPIMRRGLRAAITQEADMELVGEAADGAEAITLFRDRKSVV